MSVAEVRLAVVCIFAVGVACLVAFTLVQRHQDEHRLIVADWDSEMRMPPRCRPVYDALDPSKLLGLWCEYDPDDAPLITGCRPEDVQHAVGCTADLNPPYPHVQAATPNCDDMPCWPPVDSHVPR